MPISKYFGGHGEKVMRSMRKSYSPEKAEQVFYATANKRKADFHERPSLKALRKAAKD